MQGPKTEAIRAEKVGGGSVDQSIMPGSTWTCCSAGRWNIILMVKWVKWVKWVKLGASIIIE